MGFVGLYMGMKRYIGGMLHERRQLLNPGFWASRSQTMLTDSTQT